MPGISAYRVEQPIVDELRKYLSVPKERIEELVLSAVQVQQLDSSDETNALRKRIMKIDTQINTAIDAILDGMNSSALSERLERLEAEKKDIENQMLSVKKRSWLNGVEPQALIDHIYEKYQEHIANLNENDPIRTKTVIREFVQKVIIRPDHFEIWFKADNETVVLLAPPRGLEPLLPP